MDLFSLPIELLHRVTFFCTPRARGLFQRTCWDAFNVVQSSGLGVLYTALELDYLRTYGSTADRFWDNTLLKELTDDLLRTSTLDISVQIGDVPSSQLAWAPMEGLALYLMLMDSCPRLEVFRLCGHALYSANLERIQFANIKIQTYVHTLVLEGPRIQPSAILAVFPNVTCLRLDTSPGSYYRRDIEIITGSWAGLRFLHLSLQSSHTRSALACCSALQSLKVLSFQSTEVEADVNAYSRQFFLTMSDVAKIRDRGGFPTSVTHLGVDLLPFTHASAWRWDSWLEPDTDSKWHAEQMADKLVCDMPQLHCLSMYVLDKDAIVPAVRRWITRSTTGRQGSWACGNLPGREWDVRFFTN